MEKIRKIIHNYRIKESNFILFKSIIHIAIIAISILLIIILLEYTFYLKPDIRTALYHIYLFLISTSLLYSVLLWLIHNK